MIDKNILYTQIELLPDELKKEALDFIGYLLFKYQQNNSPKNQEKKSNFGNAKGMVQMASNFDEPLDEFKE